MAHWKLPAALVLGALVLAACGGGTDAGSSTTTVTTTRPLTYFLDIEDSDQGILQVRVGEEIVPRLPLTGPEDPGWVLTVPPNPAVLGGGDDLRFLPSEPGQGGAYHEFSFTAVGPGRTAFILTHGYQRFTCTVEVSPAG